MEEQKYEDFDLGRLYGEIKPVQFFPRFWRGLKDYQVITLFKTNTRGLSNDWTVQISLPRVSLNGYENDLGELTRGFLISLSTVVKYTKVSYFWDFSFKILGFGLSIGHQTGY